MYVLITNQLIFVYAQMFNLLMVKALIGNSRRSLHVVYSVALCVALIFSSFTISDGFMDRMGLVTEGYTVSDVYLLVQNGKSLSDSMVSREQYESIDSNVTLCPFVFTWVTLPGTAVDLELWGAPEKEFGEARKPRIKGSFPVEVGEVMVGEVLADRYKVEVGSVVEVDLTELKHLTVTGVYLTYSHYDQGLVTGLNTITFFKDLDGYSFAEFKTTEIEAFLRENADQLSGLDVLPLKGMLSYIDGLGSEIHNDLYVFGVFIASLVLVYVCLTLYKILGDSVDEIAIIRSLGVTKLGVLGLVVVNSLLLCLFGSLLGLALGLLLSNVASVTVFLFIKSIYIPVHWTLGYACSCILLALSMGLSGALVSIVTKQPLKEAYGVLKR